MNHDAIPEAQTLARSQRQAAVFGFIVYEIAKSKDICCE
jgi:hypothetical protein